MKLLIKQEHATFFLNDKVTEEVLYGGAAGGGKSAFGCLWLISMCQNYPNTRWLMGRAKLKTLKETTLNTFFELASKLDIGNEFNYNAQSNVIYFENGSEIILKDLFLYPSDPNYDSLGSLEITGAFIDECNQVVYKAWQIVKSRIRYKLTEYNLIPKMLGTLNPAKNWTYKEFYQPSKNGTLKDYRKFIQALPQDNPHLHPSYLKSLLQLDNNSKQRLFYGNWEFDDDPSTLIDIDAIIDYFNPVHINDEGKHYITIDVARKGKDTTVYRVWNEWKCIDVVIFAKNTIVEAYEEARKLQAKYNVPNSQTIADEDGVGGGLVDMLRCEGFVNNSRALNGENYENLKSQCSILMAKKIQARECGEVSNNTHVRDLVSEEMEQIKQKEIDKDTRLGIISKDVIKANIGRSPDHWDSIMMRYYFELKPKAKAPRSRLL
jgi:phage terminase large subunit